jgi:hypothetical protein
LLDGSLGAKFGQPNALLPREKTLAAKLVCYSVCACAVLLKAYVEVYIIALYGIICFIEYYYIALSFFYALLGLDII